MVTFGPPKPIPLITTCSPARAAAGEIPSILPAWAPTAETVQTAKIVETAIATAFRMYIPLAFRESARYHGFSPKITAGRTLDKAIFLSSRKTRLAPSPHFFEAQFDKL